MDDYVVDPPGFERVEEEGQRPFYYLKPVANVNLRKKFTSAAQVVDYLNAQRLKGLNLDVGVNDFNFKKRKKLSREDGNLKKRRKLNTAEEFQATVSTDEKKNLDTKEVKISENSHQFEIDEDDEAGRVNLANEENKNKFFHQNNLLQGTSKTNHKYELELAAAELDTYRRNTVCGIEDTKNTEELKNQLCKVDTLEGIVEVLCCDEEAIEHMFKVIQDMSLQEMLALADVEGPHPLADFPNDITKNWFSEVTKFAIQRSPVTTKFLVNLIIKERRHNVEPSHVLQFATIYANLARCVTKNNNALEKMTTLLLKMGGLTDNVVNALAKQSVCVTAQSLRIYRDYFAEAAEWVMVSDTMNMPAQFGIDNCDTRREHLTVEYIETETVDTSHLCTEPMSPDEVKNLFRPEMILLGADEHSQERQHLDDVICISVGREIGKLRPDQASTLLKNLPEHHQHKHSTTPIVPAKINLQPPHYFMETNNAEMICLAEELQKKKLWLVAKQRPHDNQFHRDLAHIYQLVPGNESSEEKQRRELAEYRVEKTVREAGEIIGHGDLLTVKMFQRALLLRSGSVRAVDRLFYLGTFRLQLFHLVMNKTALDIKTGMPNEKIRVDEGSLGQIAGALGVSDWFSNKKKTIVRSNNYEKHSQVIMAYQLGLLGNMFDNFIKRNPEAMNNITNFRSAANFVKKLMEEYGVCYYWDPEYVDPLSSFECDLFKSSRNQVIRLAIDLAFRQCEKNNDAIGLRALRRLMCPYFLNKSTQQTSQYAKFISLIWSWRNRHQRGLEKGWTY